MRSRVRVAAFAPEKATERGLLRLGGLQLGRAGDLVTALGARMTVLAARGRLTQDCAAAIAAPLGALGETLVALRAGGSTTTTVPGNSTTTAPASSTVPTTSTTTTLPTCGNGRLDPGEQCDGTNLFGRDCATLGFTGGRLACRADCLFDTSGCTS